MFILRNCKPSQIIPAFELSSGVACHGYSELLQRKMVDFAADESFGGASKKLKEHYRIDVPVSSIRNITLLHANNMLNNMLNEVKEILDVYSKRHRHKLKPGVRQIVTETDGCMLPIVESRLGAGDKRKKKKLMYKEARLCLSYKQGDVNPIFAATMQDTNTTGKYLRLTAQKAGLGINSKVHAVGDGAQWIVKQLDDKFGDIDQANYLIDLYHMSEYLAAANAMLSNDEKKQKYLIKRQTDLLKDGEYLKVLRYFENYNNFADDDNAVKDCYRYMVNRPEQFAYKEALENDLPIGSGKVEGGHRHVIQSRLKISGAWWLHENADSMLALRTIRANNDWDKYWALQ